MALQQGQKLCGLARLRRAGEVQVGAVEAGGEHFRVPHRQRGKYIVARARVGGGGERHPRYAGETLGQPGERAVFGAELVAPLADAMRLVDGDQGDVEPGQPLLRARAAQPLGRDIQKVKPAGIQLTADPALLVRLEFGMQRPGRHAQLAQGGHLVVHQGDQRADDHRSARTTQGGHLVAHAFAAAGRHQHQRVAAGEQVADGLLLQAAKGRKAEHAPEHVQRRQRAPRRARLAHPALRACRGRS